MPPAYKLIFMTKQSDSGSRNTATLATTPAPPARLASKHLLGIEGLNPLEINALIARGDMFADLIQQAQPITPPLSEGLKGRTVLNLFFETPPAPAYPLNWRPRTSAVRCSISMLPGPR